MNAQQWLDQFRGELDRHNLPPLYSERLLSELSDHITDFLEDPMSTDVRNLGHANQLLGVPGEVAAAAAKEFRGGSFFRRHPILSFVVMPIVALPLLWAASILGFIALVALIGYVQGDQAAT